MTDGKNETTAVLLPIKPDNRNKGRGGAYWATAKDREAFEWQLRASGFTRSPGAGCVDVTLTRVLGKGERLWDADSVLRGNAKELLDSLVALGWFHDDGPKWIRHCDGRQDVTRRAEGPAWEIQIQKVTEIRK